MQSLLPFLALLIIALIFFVFSGVVFYHVGRYSFVGDYSKRYSTLFLLIGAFIILTSFVLMIINHIAR
jgi:hypothetical protein